MTEEEVEVEDAFAVVVGLDAEQRHSTVAGVGDDHGRVGLTGRRHAARKLELIRARAAAAEPVEARRSANVVEDLQSVIVSLGDDDVAGLCVDERRIADESAVEAGYRPLVEEQRPTARSHDRVVRIAVEHRQFALRRLRPPPVSHCRRCPWLHIVGYWPEVRLTASKPQALQSLCNTLMYKISTTGRLADCSILLIYVSATLQFTTTDYNQ